MAYKPVQNESAHLTAKNGRSAFGSSKKHAKKGSTATPRMKKPMKLEKPGKTKTRS